MELWRESFAEVQTLTCAPAARPGGLWDRDRQRLAQIDRMLAGDAPQSAPQALDLPFDRDAVTACRISTRPLCGHPVAPATPRALTRSLFEVAAISRGSAKPRPRSPRRTARRHFSCRIRTGWLSAVRIMVIMWLAYLAVIFVPDCPAVSVS